MSRYVGLWSFVGTYLGVLAAAYLLAPAGPVFAELLSFLTGGVGEIEPAPAMLDLFPSMFWILVLELPLAFLALVVVGLFVGGVEPASDGAASVQGHALAELLANEQESHKFFNLYLAVFLEEAFARWLFLGVLTRVLTGPIAFYILLLIGNGLWAAVHLTNFRDPADRKLIRVLPQFLSGLFFSYVYVKHGFVAVILTHFAANSLLFSLIKIQNTNRIDGLQLLLSLALTTLGAVILERPLSDLAPWFQSEARFALAGWGFRDYLGLYVLIAGLSSLIFDLLCYDRNDIGKPRSDEAPSILSVVIVVPVVLTAVAGVLSAGYWLSGLIIEDTPLRVLLLATALVCATRSPSYSAAMRKFWGGLAVAYVTICIFNAVSFGSFVLLLLCQLPLSLPKYLLDRRDD